jgi:hypothetical protein
MKGGEMKHFYKVISLLAVCLTLFAFSAFAANQDGTEGVSQVPPAGEQNESIDSAPTCLNFDNLSAESVLTTYGGVTFTNTHGTLRVKAAYPGPVFSSPNAVLPDNYTSSGNRTRATFASPVSYVSVTMGDWGADSDNLYLRAYNSSNNLIDSDAATIPSSLYGGVDLEVSAAGIAYVEFYGVGLNNNSVYFDNLCFEAAQCDYCLTDSYGYDWCLNLIASDGQAYYLDGTVTTGAGTKDAMATYVYNGTRLNMTAIPGSGYYFNYNTTFISSTRATGVWVNEVSGHGDVTVNLVECGTAAALEANVAGPTPDVAK